MFPCGPAVARGFAGMSRPASDILSRTKMWPSRHSARQQELAFNAGAVSASPVL
jgi:hypothetical protein